MTTKTAFLSSVHSTSASSALIPAVCMAPFMTSPSPATLSFPNSGEYKIESTGSTTLWFLIALANEAEIPDVTLTISIIPTISLSWSGMCASTTSVTFCTLLIQVWPAVEVGTLHCCMPQNLHQCPGKTSVKKWDWVPDCSLVRSPLLSETLFDNIWDIITRWPENEFSSCLVTSCWTTAPPAVHVSLVISCLALQSWTSPGTALGCQCPWPPTFWAHLCAQWQYTMILAEIMNICKLPVTVCDIADISTLPNLVGAFHYGGGTPDLPFWYFILPFWKTSWPKKVVTP